MWLLSLGLTPGVLQRLLLEEGGVWALVSVLAQQHVKRKHPGKGHKDSVLTQVTVACERQFSV